MSLPSNNIRGIILIITCSLLKTNLFSQDILRPPSIPLSDNLQISTLSFDRFLNTDIWDGILQLQRGGAVWNLHLNQLVRSRFIKTDVVSIQDEYRGSLGIQSQLSEHWGFQIHNSSNVVADSRIIDLGKMSQHEFLSGVRYVKDSSLSTSACGGYALYSQENERDNGFTYLVDFAAQRLKIEEFIASVHSTWDKSFMGRRSPHDGRISCTLLRDFGNDVNDSLTFDYSVQKREFYTSLNQTDQAVLGIQHDIFNRTASVYEIKNQLRYNVGKDLSFIFTGGMSNELIDRGYIFKNYYNPSSLILDSHIQELQLYGSILFQWSAFKWLDADLTFSSMEREERHSIQEGAAAPLLVVESQRSMASRLENSAQRNVLTLGLLANVSTSDMVRWISSASILRYDTPDTLNVDDRDELLFTAGVEETHFFSPRLIMALNADLTLFHLVYLNHLKSANNNWNRVFRLSSRVDYMPAMWFHSTLRSEVLANYTVSDYEEQVASVKSYSFRQAFWSDSTVIQIGEMIQFKFSGSVRIFERGSLLWKEFKERPEDQFIEGSLWPEIFWSSRIGFTIGIGFKYFVQSHYKYGETKWKYNGRNETRGPTVSMEWKGLGRSYVWITGWREEQRVNETTIATISNLSIKVGYVL